MIHCLTSFCSSGNTSLRIYLRLYGKLPLPRGMGFTAYAEFTVTSGIYHIPRLQGLGIIFTQPAVHIYLSRPEQLQAVTSGFIIYLGNDSINTRACYLNDLSHRFFLRYFCRRIHHLTPHVGVADLLQIITDKFRNGILTEQKASPSPGRISPMVLRSIPRFISAPR